MFALAPAQEQFLATHVDGFGVDAWISTLAGVAGSDRRFVRVRPRRGAVGQSRVLVLWDSKDQDWTRFLSIPEELKGATDALPEVFASDARLGLILVEDLGPKTLHVSCSGASRTRIRTLYRSVIDELARWHRIDPVKSPAICARALDRDVFLWETAYFAKHCVTEFLGCEELLGADWETERAVLAERVSSFARVCTHRDFQSENVMILNRRARFVDFQGARLGPAGYDLASLVYDPYAAYIDEPLAAELVDHYALASPGFDHHAFSLCALQRLMQALGAYGNLSLHKGKDRYRAYIPLALERLERVSRGLRDFPAIHRVVAECAGKTQAPGR